MFDRLDEEMEGAVFGDKRLSKRLVYIIQKCSENPKASFPQMNMNRSQLEALYRFMNNDKVTSERIIQPHIQKTAVRCQHKTVVIAHDTTAFTYKGENTPEDIGILRGKTRGFFSHVSLAVDLKTHETLGLLNVQWNNRRKIHQPENEGLRWGDGVQQVADTIDSSTRPIHVVDREADSFRFFQICHEYRQSFVSRIRQNRTVLGEYNKLFETMSEQPVVFQREVPLSKRRGATNANTRSINPPRERRTANLSVRGIRVEIKRPASVKSGETVLPLSYIWVTEENPPPDCKGIDWKLLSNLPIDGPEDIAHIIDCYQLRWKIEEYFKALKTGCGYNLRQQHSYLGLVNTISVMMPIAWRIVRLKELSSSRPEAPATTLFSEEECLVLNMLGSKKLPKNPTLKDFLYCLAFYGGYIKQKNSSPGWQVLCRGLHKLEENVIGWKAAYQFFQERSKT